MKNLISNILDQLYPPICEICGCALTGPNSLCDACKNELPEMQEPHCQNCSEYFEGQIDENFKCPNCKSIRFHFDFARSAMRRNEALLEIIHRFKYGKEIHLGYELGKLVCKNFADPRFSQALEENWLLVPVPLHYKRKRERYFNQAEEIVKIISLETGLAYQNLLCRTRATETQTQLTRRERMANLKGAFSLNGPLPEGTQGYLIVDDVFTTGSTVNACAKVLRKAGAKRIAILTVMRG